MDEMKIESKFMRGLASRFIRKAVRDKTGLDMDIQLNGFRTTIIDDILCSTRPAVRAGTASPPTPLYFTRRTIPTRSWCRLLDESTA